LKHARSSYVSVVEWWRVWFEVEGRVCESRHVRERWENDLLPASL